MASMQEFLNKIFHPKFFKLFEFSESVDNRFQAIQLQEWQRKGVSPKSIEQFTDPVFNKEQQSEIKWGIEHGLTEKQIDVLANPAFSHEQMFEIRWGFEKGLSMEQVEQYADPDCSPEDMRKIQEALLSGFDFPEKPGMEQTKENTTGFSEGKDFGETLQVLKPALGTKILQVQSRLAENSLALGNAAMKEHSSVERDR